MKTIVENLENREKIKTKIKEKKRGKREGFSFIELLIMLVILSIISGMSYMAYMRMDPKMDIAVERQAMGELAKAIAILSTEGKIRIRGDVAIPGNTALDNCSVSTYSGKINDGMITTGQAELEKIWGRGIDSLDDTWRYVRLNRTETIRGKTYNESRLLLFRGDAAGTGNFAWEHPMRRAYIHERISVPDSAWE